MTKLSDIRVTGARLYLLPLDLRMPLKFGAEVLTQIICARVKVTVQDRQGKQAIGWGETPLSVQWVWPSKAAYQPRYDHLREFSLKLTQAWPEFDQFGHPMEVGHDFQEKILPDLLEKHNKTASAEIGPMPWLAGLVACSPFDIALHDAFGNLVNRPVYDTYTAAWMNRDLAAYLEPSDMFRGKYPADFFVAKPPTKLKVWHLVGGLDPLKEADLNGQEPKDGHPVLLADWIRNDGLKCLKIKLRGTDPEWDYARLIEVGKLAQSNGALWLSPDFNCTVQDPAYVDAILDKLIEEHPALYGMILYVEQPFPYELEHNRIDVHSVSARKPLFLDESAHDWRLVALGRELGWTGVALKTCKTQTGALLTMCWAKAHGMTLMVQDLTNPMLAQVPHVQLAAHAGTIMGVECNAMQYYPDASVPEAKEHPGLYRRRNGVVDLITLGGSGFGYKLNEIQRSLSEPVAVHGKE